MTLFTRRKFLQGTLLGSLSGVSGFYHIYGTETTKVPGKNDLLGVMLVGCGGRGMAHLHQYIRNPNTQIICLCDPDRSHAEKMASIVEKDQGKRPTIVADMRDGLVLPGLDIVTCATPNHWHALCGVWAMQAKKDLYLEKPICHNLHEGRALLAAALENDRICQVGTQFRSFPSVQDGIKFVKEGGIGEVKLARGLCYKRRPAIGALGAYSVPEGIDYNLWSGPAPLIDPMTRPKLHYDWHWQRLYGNGDLGNQGPHQTDISRCVLGEEEFPINVISYGGRLGYPEEKNDPSYRDAGDTANTEVSIYNYADGKTLVFETRGLPTEKIYGADIGVIAYGTEGYWVHYQYQSSIAYDNKGKIIKKFNGIDNNVHFDNFITCVLHRTAKNLNAPLRTGQLSAGISHLGNISWYLGEKNTVSPEEARRLVIDIPGHDNNLETFERTFVHLNKNKVDLRKTPISFGTMLAFDPKKETFIDNQQAQKMETREYREGFEVK